ncbi:ABC transporter ATP-binding protein [Neorickettsia sennetsu]|uniref:ABC transporter, ATP-binding protein n=1 Tax=Ehrlichia sennetsu (strain ATCC VR-367 / Miyayama) TaxID=222891 RepID=Q2GD72_EHRS3|nr:ATP-binding cassette domain-containing protein [Neorickettsia sennetsu]ABD46324.1 ABC transporter, ATP-binding protein [Neorickettsia sennetsu str. Miyayama]
MKNKISVRDLSVSLCGRSVLNDVNLDLSFGETLSVIGKSGEGKSVLLKSIIGLIPRNRGVVRVDGEEIKENVEEIMHKHNIAISFQNDCLFDSMTILENLCFPLTKRNGISKQEAIELSKQVLCKTELPLRILTSYPSALSGGMKKKIAVARTIITQPEIIFFDEPTTGLDPVTAKKITEMIREYTTQEKISSIIVTHDLKCSRKISDRVAMLHLGKIIWQGNTGSLDASDNPHIKNFLSYA